MTTDLPPVICLSCACLEEASQELSAYYKLGYRISQMHPHQDAFFRSYSIVLVHKDFIDSKEDSKEGENNEGH